MNRVMRKLALQMVAMINCYLVDGQGAYR